MTFLILLFIGLILYKLKIAQRHECFSDYLSKEYTTVMKGVCAVVIILHHISQRINGGIIFDLFARVGCLAVAVFYLLSGYGLMKNFIKNKKYLDHFISRRLSKIVTPYIILVLLNMMLITIRGTKWSFALLVDCLLYGEMGIIRVWFILSIILMYLFFFMAFRLGGKNLIKGISVLLIFVVGYVGICYIIGSAGWWYNACLAFVVGVLWCVKEEQIILVSRQKYLLVVALLMVVYGLLRMVNVSFIEIPAFYIISTILPPPIFASIIVLIGMKFKISNRLWRFFGTISFELYLVHSFVIDFIRDIAPDISNVVYVVTGLATSIIVAVVLKYVNQKICK